MRYPLEIRLKPSARLQALIAAIHLVAAIAFVGSQPSVPANGAVLALLGLSAAVLVRSDRRLAGSSIVLEESGLLDLRLRGGSTCGAPLPGCTDFGWALWFQWRELAAGAAPRARSHALMLLPDHVGDPSTWRQLRIWLRHKSARPVSAGDPP
ncbi:MAG TPA: hypothetical protein PL143_01605 [Rhodocyclaceae bacterium]|nr:hypothetical protein [Rhodocyclaceae bacterium]